MPSTAQVVGGQGQVKALTNRYATALARQLSLSMTFDGTRLDPGTVTRAVHDIDVTVAADGADPDGPDDRVIGPVRLRVVDWAAGVKSDRPTLTLTDLAGEAFADLDGAPTAPWSYTAYVAWDGFAEHRSALLAEVMYPDAVRAVVAAGRQALRDHIRGQGDRERRRLVDAWKTEEVYPYPTAPSGLLEEAERDLFDYVATAAGTAIQAGGTKQRKLSLRLIREALTSNPADPGHLTDVLSQVLDLTPAQLADLHELLARTNLPALIETGKVIAHRLAILDGVYELVYNPEVAPHVLERRQLHEVVAAEPWLFGDEYTTAVSDRSLTHTLTTHQSLLGEDRVLLDSLSTAAAAELADRHETQQATGQQTEPRTGQGAVEAGASAGGAPVLVNGRQARIDLLLSRVSAVTATGRQHLVVELKRPAVTLGAAEISQLEQYTFAIAADTRFTGQIIFWHFTLLGARMNAFAQDKARRLAAEATTGLRYTVTTWDTLVKERRQAMAFVQRSLEVRTTVDDAYAELRRHHGDALPEAPSDGPCGAASEARPGARPGAHPDAGRPQA